eukprot:1195454-Prorocentrum_minimum.AAC.2
MTTCGCSGFPPLASLRTSTPAAPMQRGAVTAAITPIGSKPPNAAHGWSTSVTPTREGMAPNSTALGMGSFSTATATTAVTMGARKPSTDPTASGSKLAAVRLPMMPPQPTSPRVSSACVIATTTPADILLPLVWNMRSFETSTAYQLPSQPRRTDWSDFGWVYHGDV